MVTAAQIQYRQEMVATFEQQQSLVRGTTTTEAVIKGNQATFLVAGSGGATAVTRGVNGLIPARNDSLVQKTATLVEWHDLVQRTGFDIFASQGDGNAIMQRTTLGVLNRKIDQDILTALATGTVNTGAAVPATLSLVLKARTILGNADVPMDGNVFAVISPGFHAYLMQTTEFASVDYINDKPYSTSLTMFRWAGVNWIVHPNISGAGGAAEKCFMYHKDSIGHAANVGEMSVAIGYEDEQDYSFARASMFMGPVVLQNSGIIVMNHDASALAAS
jgi:hypothetical protein